MAPISSQAATCLLALTLLAAGALAQTPPQTTAAEPQDGMVTLNFPENIDLKVLIDYVGRRNGINFIYDQNVVSRRVTINAPEAIPTSSLITLLESTLRANNLVLVETEIPNTIRIEAANRPLPTISVLPGEQEARLTQAVTRVFTFQHIAPAEAGAILTPFLSSPQARITPVQGTRLLIITEFGSNMQRLENLSRLIDQPEADLKIESVTVTHTKAADLATRVTQLLGIAARPTSPTDLRIQADTRTNQIDLIGEAQDIERAAQLIANLDRPANTTTRVYTFNTISPARIDTLVSELLDEVAAQNYRSVADPEANALIVTAPSDVHATIAELAARLDIPRPEQRSPIRFYTLQNARADEILKTLEGIANDASLETISIDGANAAPQPPLFPTPREDFSRIDGPTESEVNTRAANRQIEITPQRSGVAIDDPELGLDKARIIAHEASNTLIVIARPAMHEVYERLIKRLDVRQPQVLLEATVVSLDTTDGFQLGVEILVDADIDETTRSLTFSNFGLSDEVDPGNPGLVLEPGVGFNGAIISSNIADLVVRALQSDNRVKVVSRPEILVNNNAVGTLVSEREEPFSSVNASSTVSTTSFGGFAAAGTTIVVTPQISEGDFIKLEYEISLSSFSEAAESNDPDDVLPPARQTNSLISEAVLPDGYTMIVGGLTRDTQSEVINAIPLLGEIPFIENFFSNRVITNQQTTLFVFIKAVILRDDKFEYLRFVSSEAAASTGISLGLPESQPLLIH
ncbi:secretin N-terminal domain-containing protein [Mucisphaera sp.]|uniref:secretin N-terminal domain-containing protein n=1 Tax=Mucisphaera sp. TaxID=2913024 RepID=UPI003D0B703B